MADWCGTATSTACFISICETGKPFFSKNKKQIETSAKAVYNGENDENPGNYSRL